MKIKRPGAGGFASWILYPVRGLNTAGNDRIHSRLTGFSLRLGSSRRPDATAKRSVRTPVSTEFAKISRLKCRCDAPIQRGGKTASGGRKLPEGKKGGRLFQGPPHGKDAV
jgi:hypothetical protein